uniref:SRCR domain-containing protein n=3 Tax=Bursaphelenchus xylophilus TaxID=6326 RepID=A0A1I7S6R3_BURXY
MIQFKSRLKTPFCLLLQAILFIYITDPFSWTYVEAQGQLKLPPGLRQQRQQIRHAVGGIYSDNTTLFFRNSPFRVTEDIIVNPGVTLEIETGVQLYFDTGVGIKVYGVLRAIGNEFAHIEMLPFQEQLNYEENMPEFRLVDGPSVRQGRLQMKYRDRWRSVCTMVTNWTSIDTGVACRSMGYSDGGFWRWYRRVNDTYPLAMPVPGCLPSAKNLWECDGFKEPNQIRMSENLCQGEDDIGLYCWGPPTFNGWARHWKGIQIFNSPFYYVPNDPDMVAAQRESHSRLEFIDIMYAGYDGYTKNMTAALYIEGVPPIMNGLRIQRSARDGIHFYEPTGPIILANSTVADNRGHGLVIENTTDGRLFVNWTLISGNYGDGIWYRQRYGGASLVRQPGMPGRYKRELTSSPHLHLMNIEKPRAEICESHKYNESLFFPHLFAIHLQNGSTYSELQPRPCWIQVRLPKRLDYVYTLQFLSVANRNPHQFGSRTDLIVCDGNFTFVELCARERFRLPIRNGVIPQSVSISEKNCDSFRFIISSGKSNL